MAARFLIQVLHHPLAHEDVVVVLVVACTPAANRAFDPAVVRMVVERIEASAAIPGHGFRGKRETRVVDVVPVTPQTTLTVPMN